VGPLFISSLKMATAAVCCTLALWLAASVIADAAVRKPRATLRVFTWNPLSVSDTFADDYGCKSEIARRDEMVNSTGMALANAESKLLSERFYRVSQYLEGIKANHDVIALQEVDPYSNSQSLLHHFKPNDGKWKVACQVDNGSEIVMALVNEETVSILPPLEDQQLMFNLEGVLGCSTHLELRVSKLNSSVADRTGIVFQSIHLAASHIRNPLTANATLATLLNTMPVSAAVIAGGDFNAHLRDIISVVEDLDSSFMWDIATVKNFTSTSNSTVRRYQFTTQHEHNFIASYDGFLIRNDRPDDSSKDIVDLLVIDAYAHEAGFLAKYLSNSTTTPFGTSAFHYDGGEYPTVSGFEVFDSLVNGAPVTSTTLDKKNFANNSFSDHLSVTALVSVNL
jgi:hypothetical protein